MSGNYDALFRNVFDAIATLIPEVLNNPEDASKTHGNAAVCFIDPEGGVHGRIYGTDKIRGRETYKNAWTKASQVWITGIKTGEFERRVFTGEIDEHAYGLKRPDFIGWLGGQPLELGDGTKLAAGFSGFRGVTDLDLVLRAFAKAGIKLKS